MNPRYTLRCRGCSFESDLDANLLFCPQCQKDALLYTHYRDTLRVGEDAASFFSYSWMSFGNPLGVEGPRFACFKSDALGKAAGLDDLWVLLSGQAKHLGADVRTGSFKETEAIGVLSRVREQTSRTLIISSAGNAARAFLDMGVRSRCPLVVIVPESGVPLLRIVSDDADPVPLLIVLKDAFYPEAIRFVDRAITRFDGRLVREGGCYNVARRDAMGIPFLRAVQAMGGLPDRYVQAVGSGTGAIAAWEAQRRLTQHGHCPAREMRLHLVQNSPFVPMANAWAAGSRTVEQWSDDEIHRRLGAVYASVLSNATPPYAVRGGVYDCVSESNGTIAAVSNEQVEAADRLAEDCLGVRPCAAAAVAVAGLLQGVQQGTIPSTERVLLHITGTHPDVLGPCPPYARRLDVRDVEEGLAAIEAYLSAVAPACVAAD